jgi:hypothetical protein
MPLNEHQRSFVAALVSLLIVTGIGAARGEIIELEFKQPPVSDSDTSRTLQSLVKIQGTHQFCQDGLYLMTHFGTHEDLFEKANQAFIDTPYLNDTWRHCSVFSAAGGNSVIVGRNWDNQTVGSIIVSLYQPPDAYSSISFCRSIDLGFGHKDLLGYTSTVFGNKLLLAPFFAMDGINEHGLTVAVAGLRQTTNRPGGDRKRIFIAFLMRKILDQTRNVEEAIDLVERFVPFDLDRNSLNGHLIVTDASGRSVILEYEQDQWKKIPPGGAWQVLTTKPIYNVSDQALRDECWRYRTISEALESTAGDVDWQAGMGILQDVSQVGTTWSVVYAPSTKELYFSVYQDWDVIYHLRMP